MKNQRFSVSFSADEVERILAIRGQQRDSVSNMLAKLVIGQVEYIERCQRGDYGKKIHDEQPAWTEPPDVPAAGKPSISDLQAKINGMQTPRRVKATDGRKDLDPSSSQDNRR